MRVHSKLSEAEIYRLPRPAEPAITPGGFAWCPAAWQYTQTPAQWHCQMALYRSALEQAQAVVRPSLPERNLLAVWN